MPTNVCARRLFLRTSRRLGSAPVRLACSQRVPKRGLVRVCPGRRHTSPYCTIQSPASPPHRGTAVSREPKLRHLGGPATMVVGRAKAWPCFGKFVRRSVFVVSPKGKSRMRVVVATSAAQQPTISRLDVCFADTMSQRSVDDAIGVKCQAVDELLPREEKLP